MIFNLFTAVFLIISLGTAKASTVNKIRIFCKADGKYNSMFVGVNRANCTLAVNYFFDSKNVDGSYQCVDNHAKALLISNEITAANTSVETSQVRVSKNASSSQNFLVYKDKFVEFKINLTTFLYGYGKKQKIEMSHDGVVLKGTCSGVVGTDK